MSSLSPVSGRTKWLAPSGASAIGVRKWLNTSGQSYRALGKAKVDAASAGLPVGVQVVGRAWRDHEALAVMRAIESDVARDEGYPATPVEL